MRRTLIILAATAVAAVITIPAVAQDGSGGGQDPALARFTACLTAHGVTVPAGLGGLELKQWLAARQDDATVSAALQACAGPRPDSGRGFEQLYSCLRAHGVDLADAPDAVKREVVALTQIDAGKATLAACQVSVDKPADKGDAAPAKEPRVCGNKE
jgi:hypothetical protein